MTLISLQPFRDFFEKKEQIRFAYLFGSYAKNSQTSLSDVDIAVYLDERLDFFTQRLKLTEDISRDTGGRSIDLVVLNNSSLTLQYEVISHCMVLKDNASERVDFETRVLRNYLDTEPLRHSYIEAVKKSFIKESSLVNKRIIAARLERLQEYLTNLEAVQQFDCKRFVDDPFVHGTAERNLHLAIECLLDIGNHIIVDRNYPKPESYADIFKILSDEQVISQDLFNNLEGMAALRNILVHDYMRLDRKRVYEIIKLNTCHLKDLGTVFAACCRLPGSSAARFKRCFEQPPQNIH